MAKKYRFTIFNDTTHEKIFSIRANGPFSIVAIVALVLVLVVSVIMLISFTSLREFIPGYPSAQSRQDLIQNAIKIDSLQQEVNIWRLHLENIQRITAGEKPLSVDSLLNLRSSADSTMFPQGNYAKDDSLLRAAVFQEEQFNLSSKEQKIEQIEGLHFFPPLKGVVTQEYNPAMGHPYLDIAAPENSVVSATLNGTIISAGWDDENGYTIHIQHDNNLVSVYKHNSKLLKKSMDKVAAGTPIALTGNTGTLSTAPHLHFELWHKGEAIDPQQYIKF
ncbi:MAG: M23 family metallopeptidase [Bacteroidales bacterium]|nr:M23 family metallopeptidase [Bacteroidales bacterium]